MSKSLLATKMLLGLKAKSFADAGKLYRDVHTRSYPQEAPLSRALRQRCQVKEWTYANQKVVTLIPRKGRTNLHILYLHGGAYIHPLIDAHWRIIRALIDATGASVTIPFYALAPESDHIPGTTLVDAVYDHIVTSYPNERIIVAGDSAGGNFALSLALRRRDAGLSLPHHLILFSPWLDLMLRDERMRDLENSDVILSIDGLRECGKWWAGKTDPASPYMSPLYADITGLPAMTLFQGAQDVFVVDARTFAKSAKALCKYHEYPGAFHVFMGATFTPEAKDVFRHIRARVNALREPLRDG
ncbi:alpha/beta hydrolase [Acetobacter orleanensis]|nr:alpha/beta hydrolase [Acetobacter orleanensis]PCD80729.1 alpha/beta hydrolase [Acetobacter orleanensis]